MSFWTQELLWWKDEEDENGWKWNIQRNAQIATIQNGMSGSELACSIQDEICCV